MWYPGEEGPRCVCARTRAYVRLCVCVWWGKGDVVEPFPGGQGPSEGVVGWQEECAEEMGAKMGEIETL